MIKPDLYHYLLQETVDILEETLRRLQVECEVHEKMKKDLQERNNFLLIEIESLRYVSSQMLFVLFETNLHSEINPSVFREPQEPLETSADVERQMFPSSGYF